MKKKITGVVLFVVCCVFMTYFYAEYKGNKIKDNETRAHELKEEIFKFIALVEGDEGEGQPYYCGARWTMWFGTTVKPDGTRVKSTDKPVSRETGKEWAMWHIEHRVLPYFKYFTARLSDEQIIGKALFIYNIGGEAVTGYDLDGNKCGKPSYFMLAVNNGEDSDVCVQKMTRYRRSAGKRANGLLKRCWVQGAAYKGLLTANNIDSLCPTKFYETKNMGNYYWLDKNRKIIMENNECKLRYDETTLSAFFAMNKAKEGEKSVISIIP